MPRQRNVLWIVMAMTMAGLVLTLSTSLVVTVAGMALATFGFFASHSVASSWVGRRAREPRALASALYLFFYYLGGSLVAWMAGLAWDGWAWNGVVAVLVALLGAALLIALRLRGLAPVGTVPAASSAAAKPA